MRALRRLLDSDIFYSFRRSPLTIVAAVTTLACVVAAVFAGWLAPHNPFDLKTLNLLDAFTPPAWAERGNPAYLLGTDDQGRDVLSAIMYGSRVSLMVGFFAATQIDFNLSSIAAILTVIGYSLNDTVVIFDRIREVLRKYKQMAIRDVINLATNQTLARTIMTSLTRSGL